MGPSFINPFDSYTNVHKYVKKLMQKAVGKLDDQVVNVAEQTVLEALKTCEENLNKDFNKAALRRALNGLWPSMMTHQALGILLKMIYI